MTDTHDSLSSTQKEALDCWIHGVAHLCTEFDQQETLRIMATVIVELTNGGEATIGKQKHTQPSVGRSG
jgi:hypothetical protein